MATRTRPSVGGGIGAALWLVVVAVPIYYLLATSLRGPGDYMADGPLALPDNLTLDNYLNVLEVGFLRFLANSLVVACGSVALVLAVALPAAFAIVRGRSRALRVAFLLFLLGLAVPAQAVIIPIYLIITRLSLYDSLTAIILPTAAFTLPISIVVLTSSLRDVPGELYEAMALDGATNLQAFLRLVLPLARPGVVTVAIFVGLNAWNNFLFPLVLTQSEENRVLPLGLWSFQTQYGTDVPGLMAAVVLSTLPIFALYLFGRRHLLGGLAAGFGK
ncbi:carbohydrate ABC transporter permease [Nocardiopsis tropica]|jgi:raffinose/stachyose/melibiose transport system permease protein/xylobiose transport system permease protein|uniref:Carbohydrate ABC transporter permease n=1 Tax=Nocardiopsis tropica TaxID=109330 RepID=A0ABU7KYE3_9ACTN|nr:carbohydrate ABC transporter permease [Nocardiopsis umidischolae]MEE2054304.1 carbohydrate ABC transporter permease [Nocardiopsis umidischolae]